MRSWFSIGACATPDRAIHGRSSFLIHISAAVLLAMLFPSTVPAQDNSWTNTASGKWEDSANWSLGIQPTNSQSLFLTNDLTKTVTIDATTSGSYPETMTVTNVILFAPSGVTNTLVLSDAGTTTPLHVLENLSVTAGGMLLMSNSALVVDGLSGGGFSLDGGVGLYGTNTLLGDVYIGFSTNSTGSVSLANGQSILTNGYTVIGFYGSGMLVISNATLQAVNSNSLPQGVFLGLNPGSQGILLITGGSCIAPEHLSLGESGGATGLVWMGGGQLILTNEYLTTIGGNGVGQMVVSDGEVLACSGVVASGSGSQGTLTISGGSATFTGPLFVGGGIGATGAVSVTGGQLTVTNRDAFVGLSGVGQMTISNGVFLARTVDVGHLRGSQGTLTIAGGNTFVSSTLVAGVFSNGVGVIQIAGGNLFVTNQTGTAQLIVGQQGQGNFTQSGGASTVDQLLVTNGNKSIFNFSSGVVNSKSTTVSNTQMFAVGNGVGAATFRLLGGIHTFAGGLRIRSSSILTGCGTINGSVLVDAGGTATSDCGGTLTFTGIVTNNGVLQAINGSVLESYASVVNYGVINVMNGQTNFHSGIVNYGVVLTSDSIPHIVSVSVVRSNVWISFTTVSGMQYFLEDTTDLAGENWTPVIGFIGTGGIMTVIDKNAAVLPKRFYRIRLVIPP